jgi:hypothetical protein
MPTVQPMVATNNHRRKMSTKHRFSVFAPSIIGPSSDARKHMHRQLPNGEPMSLEVLVSFIAKRIANEISNQHLHIVRQVGEKA